MDENLVVYETVRNEILRVQESTTNETIYMYVAYITLFSIGFSYNWVFLASFIVLIVFQALINKDWWEMRKCSIFIRTFFEEQRDDIHWESLHVFKHCQTVRSLQDSEIGWKLYKWSSTFLATISLISLVFTTFNKSDPNVSSTEITILVVGSILFCIAVYVNILFSYKSDEKEANLRECIKDFFEKMQAQKQQGRNNS